MVACTRCGFQQNGMQAYCEHCGMFLPTLAVYNPMQPQYIVAPQIAPRPKQRFLEGNLTTTMMLNRCMREVIAIFGLLIAAFGLFGALSNLVGLVWALLLGLALLVGGIVFVSILFFVRKLLPHLRWWQILVGGVCATVLGFIMVIIASATTHAHTIAQDLGLGTSIFVYGLVIATLAVW